MTGHHLNAERKNRFSFIGLIAAPVTLSGTWQPRVTIELATGQEQIGRIQVKELEGALQLFFSDIGRYPTSSEGLEALVRNLRDLGSWKGPYLAKELPKDPWDKPYIYRCPGRRGAYHLMSCGPDRFESTVDDIVSWK